MHINHNLTLLYIPVMREPPPATPRVAPPMSGEVLFHIAHGG
jgi:hypothetical protein